MTGWEAGFADRKTWDDTLAKQGLTSGAMALQLARYAGLTRQEIQCLTWEQVDLHQRQLQLPGRIIGLQEPLSTALAQWEGKAERWVLTGQKGQYSLPSLSRLAAQTCEKLGLAEMGLAQLRHWYILEQLECRSWGNLCQELGMDEVVLRKAYGAHVTPPQEKALLEPARLEALFKTQPATLGKLAVGLAWLEGISPGQMRTLTWEELLSGQQERQRQQPHETLFAMVEALAASNQQAFVFGQGQQPITAVALSRLARQCLVSHGLEGLTLQALAKASDHHRQYQEKLAQYVKQQPYITAKQAQTLLSFPKSATYRLLQALVQSGELVQVGGDYYHGALVPPLKDHQPLVVAYLQRKHVVYVKDVATLLHIRQRHCHNLLQTLVTQGLATGAGSRYEWVAPRGQEHQ